MSIGFFDGTSNDEVTLHGLEKWTCHLYEHLGWVTLAHENGRDDKVQSYLISINKLKSSIESRQKIVTSEDAKLDLTTLLSKTKHLKKIASKLFDEKLVRKNICAKCAHPINPNEQDSMESEPNEQTKLGGSNRRISRQTNSAKSIRSAKSAKLNKQNLNMLSGKKNSKVSSKKSSKKSLKKLSARVVRVDKPLIKKLSKTQSKKSSKKDSKKIFRK